MAKKFTTEINEYRLVGYLLNELPPEERDRVEAWINADAANRHYFESIRTAWQKTSLEVDVSVISEDAEWAFFRERLADKPTPKIIRLKWVRMAVAAVLTGVIATVVLWSTAGKEHIENRIIAEAVADTSTLPDGSVITLNKRSSLVYDEEFGKDERSVHLEGEAFFAVAHDKQKPFLVKAGDVEIKVVGTSFNVRTTSGITEVIVETGLVQVRKADGFVELSPGEKITSVSGRSLLVKEMVKDSLYNYYRTKKFECRGTPLWQLAEKLNEAFNVNITIREKDLRGYLLTGTFENVSLTELLELIGHTLNIKVDQKGNEIILHK